MNAHTAENDAATEYRVMWWSEEFERWFPHTTINTDRAQIAEAWLGQAVHRGPGGERTEAFIEERSVSPWCRVTPPVSTDGGDQ